EALQPLRGAPVGGDDREIPHHDAPAERLRGLVVVGIGAVVADVRVGEGHNLPGVGGVRDDLLVPAHRRVEDELPGGHGDGRAGCLTGEDGAVGGHQQRRRTLVRRPHRCATASITTASPRSTVWRTAPVKLRPAYGVLRLRLARRSGSTTVDAVGSNTHRLAVAPISIGPPWALCPARRASVALKAAIAAGCALISAKMRSGGSTGDSTCQASGNAVCNPSIPVGAWSNGTSLASGAWGA